LPEKNIPNGAGFSYAFKELVVANVGQNRARLVMPIRPGREQLQAALRR
jgi:hypothetical protein